MKNFWRSCLWLVICISLLLPGLQIIQAQESEDVNVSGRVLPNENHFQLTITPSTINTLSQDTNITFTITYGSYLGYPDRLIIEADWDLATVEDAAIPTVDLVQFNDGSATNAYAQTPAVVDKVNHTIRWVIDAFPAHTADQTVSFSMNTNFSYMNSGRLTFPVRVRLINPSYSTNYRTVINSYEYDRNRSTPYSYSGPIPTPTPIAELAFSRLLVKSVSDNTIELYIITSKNADLLVKYGISLGKLSQTLTLSPPTWTTVVTLKDLKPTTDYYIQIIAKSGSQTVTSNILKLTTAGQATLVSQLDKNSLVFVSSDIATFNPIKPENPSEILNLVLPRDITYIFAFRVNQPQMIKRVQAILLDNRILGASTELSNQAEDQNIYALDLLQITPGSYQGKLKTPNIDGEYQLVAQIYNMDGQILNEPLADISVSEPLSVFDKKTNQPIEKAQIKLARLDSQTGTFQPLSTQEYAIRISGYTDKNGQMTFFLPTGMYQIEIDSLGYKREITSFEIGTEKSRQYPRFYITPEPFSLISFFYYYGNITVDFINTSTNYIQSLASSNRFFELNAFLMMSLLIIFAFLSFRARIHIPITSMFDYFFHLGKVHLSAKDESERISGKIVDKQTKNKLAGSDIYLLNLDRQTIVGHMHTDNEGEFTFLKLPQIKYALQISRPGYEMKIIENIKSDNTGVWKSTVEMEKIYYSLPLKGQLYLFFRQVLDMLFEFLLTLSLLLEIAMTYVWGWDKTIIFLAVSIVNLVLWVAYLVHQNVKARQAVQ